MFYIKSIVQSTVKFNLALIMVAVTLLPASAKGLSCATSTANTAANAQSITTAAYQDWKQAYVVDAGNGQLRVQRSASDNYDTVSEGIGYGMLFAVYSNDKTTFDGLWSYAQAHSDNNGLMNWRIAADGSTTGYNGATDADEDMATALVAADTQWGGYKAQAQRQITLVKTYEVEGGSNIIKPGDVWGGSNLLNPSYIAPSYYTVFASYMNDNSWNDVKAANEQVLNTIHTTSDSRLTGYIPDWSKADGTPADGMDYNYGYDGSRAPLRLALSSAWDCDATSNGLLTSLNATNQSANVSNLASSYYLNGTVNTIGDGTPLLAAASAAATVSDNAGFRSTTWNALVNAPSQDYFSDSMRLFSLFVAGGRLINPLLLNPTTPVAAPPVVSSTYMMSGSNVTATNNTTVTSSVSVSAPKTVNNSIVDLEVYDASGTRVAQKFYENQSVTSTPSNYTVSFIPSNTGTYTVRGGIFTSNWSSNFVWNSAISAITVTSPAAVTAPPTAPPVTVAPQPVSSNLSIWWPSNGQTVRGVQPFKAVLDGASLDSYTMYWQVDGGTLNILGNSTVDAPHKESLVDVSSWNWRSNQQYTINFVAKNANGVILSQKATTITVAH